MNKNWYVTYSLSIGILLTLFSIVPAFAEVSSLDTDSDLFFQNENIKFIGTVEEGTTGLVTIVVRDVNEEFILLTQATINPDKTFERIIPIEDNFSESGLYYATGFILTLTKGVTTEFEIIPDNIEGIENQLQLESQEMIPVNENKPEPVYEPVREPEPVYEPVREQIVYIEDETQSTVHSLIDNEIIPEAEAISDIKSTPTDNSEIVQVSLAVAGLGILFGAVYGIKRKVDDNSKQISINRDIIKKKLIRPIIRSNPENILQIRLAKGEITVNEYEILKAKLS
ncbi:MAG: SHOCT domain-containing protein [Nitrosopumilus sp.]